MKNAKGLFVTMATIVGGLLVALWVVRWADKNDIPVLADLSDTF